MGHSFFDERPTRGKRLRRSEKHGLYVLQFQKVRGVSVGTPAMKRTPNTTALKKKFTSPKRAKLKRPWVTESEVPGTFKNGKVRVGVKPLFDSTEVKGNWGGRT